MHAEARRGSAELAQVKRRLQCSSLLHALYANTVHCHAITLCHGVAAAACRACMLLTHLISSDIVPCWAPAGGLLARQAACWHGCMLLSLLCARACAVYALNARPQNFAAAPRLYAQAPQVSWS